MSRLSAWRKGAAIVASHIRGDVVRAVGRLCACSLMLALLWVPSSVLARDNYWVLGSFAKESTASREAKRLGQVAATQVGYQAFQRTDGSLIYRIVAPASIAPDAVKRLRAELAKTSVRNLWQITLTQVPESLKATETQTATQSPSMPRPSTQSPSIPSSSLQSPSTPTPSTPSPSALMASEVFAVAELERRYQLVVASTTDVDAAVALELKLQKDFAGVSSMTALDDSKVQHRVLIGPAPLKAFDPVIARLQEMGITGTWMLPYESEPNPSAARTPLLLMPVPQETVSADASLKADEKQVAPLDVCGRAYNLARLQRDCPSS